MILSAIQSAWVCGFVLAALLSVGPVSAATLAQVEAPVPVEAYGKLPSIETPRLSPDGTNLAYLSSVEGRRCLMIRRLDVEHDGLRAICPGAYEVRWFAWKTADILIVEVYAQAHAQGAEQRTESRLVTINLTGHNVVPLVEPHPERAVDFGQDRVIDLLPDDPAHILIAAYDSDADSPDVIRVDVNTGRRRTIVAGQDRITTWKTDPTGAVRLGIALDDGIVKVFYRDDSDSPFRLIRSVQAGKASAFSVLAIGDRPGTLYVSSTEPTGYRAVYQYDVASDRFAGCYASPPSADIDTLILDRGQPVAYGFTVDEPQLVYTEPAMRAEAETVAAALPQFRTNVVDSADGGRRLLIFAAGGNRPGKYFLLTRQEGKAVLLPLGAVRPDITDQSLAPVTPVSFQARDGLTIHGYLTLPPGHRNGMIPFVVLPHGGPSARDALGFDYLAQMLASRGYGVLQPNYRGSRGYGGAFEQAGFQQWGLKMQDDVTDGTRWLIDRKLADPKRICIVGWSYGGYVALTASVKTPQLYRCAASIAGVTDLRRRLDRAQQSRFADINLPRFDRDPAVMAENSPVLQADRVQIPILLVHGRRDFTVSVADSEAMEQALRSAGKSVEALYFDDDDHYLFREEDRIRLMRALERFLAANLTDTGVVSGSKAN